MTDEWHVVVPARYASTRLPAKPLADIGGLPMVVRTANAAKSAAPTTVTIATDDERVADAARQHDIDVVLTDPDHPSGTDRVYEVAHKAGWSDDALVVNVQGDEPLVPAPVLAQLREGMAATSAPVGTLCERLSEAEDLFNPNIVKLVRDENNTALYFSRAPIPWAREAFADAPPESLPRDVTFLRHIGIYAFRVAALKLFVERPVGTLEQIEKLEQLRFMEAGLSILALEACADVPGGVDTPEDLEAVRRVVAARSQQS